MELDSQILFSSVMHKRLFPKENSFSYRVYYMAFDIDRIDGLSDGRWFGLEKWGLSSFHRKDHGPCDGSSLKDWADGIINEYSEGMDIQRIVLIAMPRVLGHGFNPVSFWLCLDSSEKLRAVIAEVHNTFGERHVYFCRNEDSSPISRDNPIEALKQFHVSPFLVRSGHYSFRFDLRDSGFSVWLDYYDENSRKQLLTSLSGSFVRNTRQQRLLAFIKCPLVTLKTVLMIHWQAVKLLMKGIRYIPRPEQLPVRVIPSGKVSKG